MRRQVLSGARRFLSSRRNSETFASLASALRVFHDQNDHFVVPYSFQVPSNESSSASWPENTRGLNLGREIRKFVATLSVEPSAKLQHVRQQLDAIGFPEFCDWKRFQWEQVSLPALTKYKQIMGNLLVPRKFKVPKDDDQWPKATWGLNLGSHVNFLRSKRDSLLEYQIQDLEEIGFVWVVADYTWDVMFMPAVRRYRKIYGHCNVPQNFVIGEGGEGDNNGPDMWPQELKGCRLGAMVNRIRAVSAYTEHLERDRKELEGLGFYLNCHDHKWTTKILPAFETYHRVYGNCSIDKRFIVPDEEPWPLSTRGIRLGFIAQNIRNRGDFFLQVAQDFEKLDEIGFVWNMAAAKWEYAVMPALVTYVRQYGNTDVPAHFVVPCEDPWPTKSHGLKLGELATTATRRKQFADFIEIDRMQLEALGFSW